MIFEPASLKSLKTEFPTGKGPSFSTDAGEFDVDKAKTELARKRKLRGQIETYLAKNTNEKIRVGQKNHPEEGDREYVVRLDERYEQMSGKLDDINSRFDALKKVIGETEDELPHERMAIRADVETPVEAPNGWWGRTVGRFADSIKGATRRIRTTFFGRSEMIATDRGEGEAMAAEGTSSPVSVAGSANESTVRIGGWGALEKGDPYAEVRYVRGTGPDTARADRPIEPDVALPDDGESERLKVLEIQGRRLKDRMGFPETEPAPAQKRLGAHTDEEYLVEEISADRAMRDLEELRGSYEAILGEKKKHPVLAETFGEQARIAREAYAGMLEAAKRAIATELREDPDEPTKKRLMRDFASVMAEIRGLEGGSEENEKTA